MTRLMIAVVIAIVMAVLAIQNQQATALTILGAQQTPEIPFGLLLVGAFSAGSLLTILLYGLVGLQRPPESKYRPIGRRVPYPESPNSLNPPTPAPTPAATPYATADQTYKSSTAFVSEPPPQDSSGSSQTGPSQTGPSQTGSLQAESPPISASQPSSYRPSIFPDVSPDPVSASRVDSSPADRSPKSSFQDDRYQDGRYPESRRQEDSRPEDSPQENSLISDRLQPEKKKSRFDPRNFNPGRFNPLNRQVDRPARSHTSDKTVGNDWGDLRTAEHLNSWEAEEVRRASGIETSQGKRGLLDFIGVGTPANAPQPVDRLTDDIAAGWDEREYAYDEYAGSNRADGSDLDGGWPQGYEPEGYDSEGYDPKGAAPQRRVYRDGLYSDSDLDSYYEGPYEEAPYEETPYNEAPYAEGPYDTAEEGVYEADYRVIVPPDKPLEEVSDRDADEPRV